jgi:hypothetical protein
MQIALKYMLSATPPYVITATQPEGLPYDSAPACSIHVVATPDI